MADALDVATHPGFWRMSMSHWMTGMKEQYRSLFKSSFVDSLQKLIPEVQPEDVWRPSAGVPAQAIDDDGGLLQDFKIIQGDRAVTSSTPRPGGDVQSADWASHRQHCDGGVRTVDDIHAYLFSVSRPDRYLWMTLDRRVW